RQGRGHDRRRRRRRPHPGAAAHLLLHARAQARRARPPLRRHAAALQGRGPKPGQGQARAPALLPGRRRARRDIEPAEEREGEGRQLGDLALQGPGRDEPGAALGDDHEPRHAPPDPHAARHEGNQEHQGEIRTAQGCGRSRGPAQLDARALEDRRSGCLKSEGRTMATKKKKVKPFWERAYKGHAYWLGKTRLGKVTLLAESGGKYHWKRAAGPATPTSSAKPRPRSSWPCSTRTRSRTFFRLEAEQWMTGRQISSLPTTAKTRRRSRPTPRRPTSATRYRRSRRARCPRSPTA